MKNILTSIILSLLVSTLAQANTCPYPHEFKIENNHIFIPAGWRAYQQSHFQDADTKLEFVRAGCNYDINLEYSQILCRYENPKNPNEFLLIESLFRFVPLRAGYWQIIDSHFMLCSPPRSIADPKACPFMR